MKNQSNNPFTKFSAGNIDCKYELIEIKFHKLFREIVTLCLTVCYWILVYCVSPYWWVALPLAMIPLVFSKSLFRIVFPFAKTGQLLYFKSNGFEISENGAVITYIPYNDISGISVQVIVPGNYGGSISAQYQHLAYRIVIKCSGGITHHYEVLNEMSLTSDDLSQFSHPKPDLLNAFQLLRNEYRIRFFTKNWKEHPLLH